MWSTLYQHDESSQRDNLPPTPPATSQPNDIQPSNDVSPPYPLSASLNASASGDNPLHIPVIPEQTNIVQNHDEHLGTTGQTVPLVTKAKIIKILWEDENTMCSVAEAKGILVPRREDNHMINGTKLLNVASLTRENRDGILKSEKLKHVVKIGPMLLKGVWVPLERALELANTWGIVALLTPLFDLDPSPYSNDVHASNYDEPSAEASGSVIPHSSIYEAPSLRTPSLCTLSTVDDMSDSEESTSSPTSDISSTVKCTETWKMPPTGINMKRKTNLGTQACLRCRKYRIKCNVTAPCKNCIETGYECIRKLPEENLVSSRQLDPPSSTKQEHKDDSEWESSSTTPSDEFSKISQEEVSTSGLYRDGQWHCKNRPIAKNIHAEWFCTSEH